MSVAIIIQARMSSSRLPGKVLRPIAGKPLIAWLLERLEVAGLGELVWVATSDAPSDDPIVEYCSSTGRNCVRGPLDDVAARFLTVMSQRGHRAAARISGDSPLLDPTLVREAIEIFEAKSVDLVTNVNPRTYPPGQSVEVFSRSALERAYSTMEAASEREHVTPRLYSSPDFSVRNFSSPTDLSGIRLVVDTPEDFSRMERLLQALPSPTSAPLADIVKCYQSLRLC
ncbi:MAG: NTP transferase domain-containing protein [Polyangiaceae bacterium]